MVMLFSNFHTQAIERLKQEVSAESPGKEVKVEFMALDLASFQSTKEFTVAFHEKNLPLHILVNNAGVAFTRFSEFQNWVVCMWGDSCQNRRD